MWIFVDYISASVLSGIFWNIHHLLDLLVLFGLLDICTLGHFLQCCFGTTPGIKLGINWFLHCLAFCKVFVSQNFDFGCSE